MRVKVVFEWPVHLPDDAEDVETAVAELLQSRGEELFGHVFNEFTVIDIEETSPWETDAAFGDE